MQKEGKKVIAIAIIVIMVFSIYGTMRLCGTENFLTKAYDAVQEYIVGHQDEIDQGQRGKSSSNSSDSAKNQDQAGESSSNSSDSAKGQDQGDKPPSIPDDNGSGQDQGDKPPSIPDGNGGGETGQGGQQESGATSEVSVIYYVMFGLESLILMLAIMYLVMTKGARFTIKESMISKKKVILTIVVVVLGAGFITSGSACITYNIFLDGGQTAPGASQSSYMDVNGVVIVDGGTQDIDSPNESKNADECVVVAKNGGNATITGTVNKSAGDGSNNENCEFYGINSGILAQAESEAIIDKATINTNAKCSNAVFATGLNSKIVIKDSTIRTYAQRSSRGLDATYGGTIEAENVDIATQGGSCATLATDRGEGKITAVKCKLATDGYGSPIIYSTGDIKIDECTGAANNAQAVVIEGKNSAILKKSTISGTAVGNKGDTDSCGIFIYQSHSGDASEGTGTFTAEESSVSIPSSSKYYKTAPLFLVTNTDSIINLKENKLNFGSGVLLNAKGTDQWGKTGSNGGNVTLNANDQDLTGNVLVDEISKVELVLKGGSTYTGTINGSNTGKVAKLELSKDSKIKLTGDTYLTEFDNDDSDNSNIDFNGHKLYVNGKAIN